jgi:Arc/MetJ-type ribon-helix-helix transcriptional regulator
MDAQIKMTLPPRVYQQMRVLIAEGWFRDEDELVFEALRRYLESHQPELIERFVREDVEWGLYGKD